MKSITISIILFIHFVSFSKAQIYSGWREENRTGVSSEKGLLKSWPEGGPDLLWSNQKLPVGFSSVSISKNYILVTGTDQQNDILVALDTLGNIKWQTIFGRAWNESNPEARCTPTIICDKVYVSSGLGDLACVEINTGNIIWSSKTSEQYKGTYGPWGIAESLLVDGDKLFYTPGGNETTMVALDRNNGSLIWKSESLGDFPGYVSPLLINFLGRKIIVNVSEKHVFAIDAETGSIIWKFKHLDYHAENAVAVWPDAPRIKCVTPIYKDGRIYVTGGYNHGGMMFDLIEEGNKVNLAWYDSVLDVHHGGVVLLNGYIYGANWLNNGDGNWCCINWNSGKKMYEEHWKCKGSIIAADGMLYIYDEKSGFVGLVKANPEKFDLVSSFKIKEGTGPYWAHPVIHKKKLYIRHGNALMAYKL
jgi:outer membrane protein assembly factor BamB